MNISLDFKTVTNPDLSGFKFYVQAGLEFDADTFADAYKLNRPDIDAQDVHSAQDAASRLNVGEWLEVTYEELDESADEVTMSAHVGAHEDLIELSFDTERPESAVWYRYPHGPNVWKHCPFQSADLRHLSDADACARVDAWVG